MHEIVTQLTSHGVMGSIVLVLAVAYQRKDKALQACMEARTEEAIEATRQMVEATNAMKMSAEALKENTQAIRDMVTRR